MTTHQRTHESSAAAVDTDRSSRTNSTSGIPTSQHSFDHGLRSRFNAWFFGSLDGYFNHILGPHKAGAFEGISQGTVVELGAGAGANMERLRPGTHLIAVEPNERMHDRLRRRAAAAGIPMTLVPGIAEVLPIRDASVDEVICSLVLCTVRDQDKTLSEVKRVLRPGGRFRFVEHVAAARWSPRRWVQVLLRRPWGWVFEGCDPARDSESRVRAAGFSSVTVQHRKWRHSPFYPVNTSIWGIAVR